MDDRINGWFIEFRNASRPLMTYDLEAASDGDSGVCIAQDTTRVILYSYVIIYAQMTTSIHWGRSLLSIT